MKLKTRQLTTMMLGAAGLAMLASAAVADGPQEKDLQAQEMKVVPMTGAKLQVSRGEQVQMGTPKLDATGEAMPGSQAEPGKAGRALETPAAGKITVPSRVPPAAKLQVPPEGMAKVLAQPPVAARGDLPPVEQLKSAAVSAVATQAEPRLARLPASGESYLAVVMRIRANGTSEVVSATEIPGPAPLSDEPKGDYLYEVRLGDRTLAVEALPDPFEAHSFGGPPGTPQALHHFERLDEATVVVKVPKARLESPLVNLSIELFKLESGAPLEKVNPEVLRELKQDRRLRSLAVAPAQKLAPQIRAKGITLESEALQVQQ